MYGNFRPGNIYNGVFYRPLATVSEARSGIRASRIPAAPISIGISFL